MNGRLARHEHGQAVDADANARGWRHAILQRTQKIVVDDHRLIIAFVGQAHLLFETLFLVDWVVQLAVGIRQLFAVHHQLETLGQTCFRAVHLGQRTHLYRIIGDECWLNECAFAEFAKNLVDQLAFAHGVVNFHLQLVADGADFVLRFSRKIVTRFLFDGIENWQSTVWRFEIDFVVANAHFGGAIHSHGNALEQLLGERHHPLIVFVLHIQLHAGEFGVVALVHALVAEVFADFVHAFESANNQSFQIEFGGDAQVHVHIERVEVRDERACACSTNDVLQRRRLHFGVASFVEHGTQGTQNGGAFQESIFHAIVHYQIDIALTGA